MTKQKPITLKEKVAGYEQLLHNLQFHRDTTLDARAVKILLDRIGEWSYAHRSGMYEDEKAKKERIDTAFRKLNDPI